MMDLPTLLVIIFVLNGEIYQEVQVAPSAISCQEVLPSVKEMVIKATRQVPDLLSATCVTLKPVLRDA